MIAQLIEPFTLKKVNHKVRLISFTSDDAGGVINDY